MKNLIEFELVYKTSRQRFYKANKLLVNTAKNEPYYELGKEWKIYRDTSKTEVIDWQIPESFDYVVISDAHTHMERLAFAGFSYNSKLNGNKPAIFKTDVIAGVNTFMTHGGDSKSCKPDGVYLRMIASANNYKYNGGLLTQSNNTL